MPSSPNKLSQFWQELKRRKVLRSLAIYAGSAFIILEAATIIFPRWGFPDWTIDLVLYLLILGTFINIIVAWIFDITPEGIQKTKPIEEVKEGEKTVVPNAWKVATYISLIVIVGLVVLNIVGGGKQLRAGDIQSLVILPFENYTGDEQLDILISGMHSMLINDVGRISEIRVISKTTSNVYKDVDMTIPQIASERKVDALMEIGVLCMGDTICFQLKVVTPDEEQLWITEYRVEKSQILNLNNEITRQIADEIMVELTPEEERLLDRDRTVDREAYDDYLRSHQHWDDLSQESLNKGLEYLNLAVEKDPDFAPLYAGLAQVWIGLAQLGFESSEIAGPKIFEYLNKALELDPDLPDAHSISAGIAVWTEWDWEKGEREFLKALELNPNDEMCRAFYGHLLMILQRPDEALSQAQLAVELDPLDPFVLALAAVVYYEAGDRQNALNHLDKALSIDPHHFFTINLVEQIAFQDGDYDKAFEAGKFMMTNDLLSSEKDAIKEIERIFDEQGFFAAYEALVQQMEIMAQDEYINPIELAVRYSWLNNYEQTMDWIEKGFELHDQNMPYLTTGILKLDSLYDNPRFIDIVEKMNLPLPED